MKCSLGISHFLEEISSLSHFIVFLYSFSPITEEGFLISPCISLVLCTSLVYLPFSPLPFPSLLFIAVCKASSYNHVAFLHFSFLGIVLIPASCTMSGTSVYSSLGTLSDLIPWIYSSVPLYNHNGFYLGLPERSSGFPYFLQFKSEFGNKEFMIWATVSSWSCFCCLYRASPCLAAKNIINLISVLTNVDGQHHLYWPSQGDVHV